MRCDSVDRGQLLTNRSTLRDTLALAAAMVECGTLVPSATLAMTREALTEDSGATRSPTSHSHRRIQPQLFFHPTG